MKAEVKTPVLIAIVTLVVVVLGFFIFKGVSNAGNLDQGQVKYTPGKLPSAESDPSKQGPGGPPPAGGPPPLSGQPVGGPGGPPPGLGAPSRG